MLSQYITYTMRALVEFKFMSVAQVAEIAGMSESECNKMLLGHPDARLTMANADNIAEFFGFAIFNSSFLRELFVPRGSSNRRWDDLSEKQKRIITLFESYSNECARNSPLEYLSYASDMGTFLEGCSAMTELIVASEEEHDQDDKDLESSEESNPDTSATVALV